MNAGSVKVTLVQRQLREDWNNREYAQVVSDNIRHIVDFLCNFGRSLRLDRRHLLTNKTK